MTKPAPKRAPTLRRWQLARWLRILREESGLDAAVPAELLDCVKSRIYHLENGRTVPSKQDLKALLELYGAMDRLEVLEEIRRHANEKGWWSIHRLPEWLGTYVGLEDAATRMRRFTQELVPGMLQTEEYAQALNNLPGMMLTEPEGKRQLAVRMERGSRLREKDFDLSVVMSEALLCRVSYMPDGVGIRQLRRMLDLMELPNVTVQVLPFSMGAHQSMSASFTLLDFPEDTLGTVMYQSFSGQAAIADKEALRWFDTCFAELVRRALDPDATAVEIEEFITGAEEIHS